jgi:hypothetical protein
VLIRVIRVNKWKTREKHVACKEPKRIHVKVWSGKKKSKLGRPALSYNNRIQINKLAVNWIISSRIRCNNRPFVNITVPKITGKLHISYATINLSRLNPLHRHSIANLRGQYRRVSF